MRAVDWKEGDMVATRSYGAWCSCRWSARTVTRATRSSVAIGGGPLVRRTSSTLDRWIRVTHEQGTTIARAGCASDAAQVAILAWQRDNESLDKCVAASNALLELVAALRELEEAMR
jgi:hypothetical protein